jgi:hypothetical protein
VFRSFLLSQIKRNYAILLLRELALRARQLIDPSTDGSGP